jgi:secondary thiamine-phosphate synthase enzyme
MLTELTLQTEAQTELVDITSRVQEVVSRSLVGSGICCIFVPHTTAGLALNENWDPTVRRDLIRALDKIVPSVEDYTHAEGNSPAHIKSVLVGASSFVPVERSRLVLGTWQGIYLAEFDGPRKRQVLVQVISA